MADAKVFRMSASLTLEDVAHALEDFLRTKKFLETEGVSQSETSYFIQARQTEGWKKFVGMDQAIQVRLSVYGDMLTVDLGAGRWVDKLGAATVGYIVFAPLLITAVIGAIGQQKLPQEIFDFVQRYTYMGKPLDINDFRSPEPEETPAQAFCAACGAVLPEGAKFCPACGKPAAQKKACPVCGAEPASEGAKFCSECGAPLN
ncbi:MAG: zinc ribbon domain-containing protein [Oscillospiraceae bacterium]|nr:zinc ribbon domain-containing protein [Oscillospiraceae bacterium]